MSEYIKRSPYQTLVDKDIAQISRDRAPNFNPLALNMLVGPKVKGTLPVWLLSLDKKPLAPDSKNVFETTITEEELLASWRVPREYRGVKIEREITIDRHGDEALIERTYLIDKRDGSAVFERGMSFVENYASLDGSVGRERGVAYFDMGRIRVNGVRELLNHPTPILHDEKLF